ncbi:acyl-CoA thioesterase/bile acid-CoA:amino acid N-acyltransferase family protein [Streptomyces chrestomyceticus]|uniref:acyl-CoA thioesterase/bile acid-CoA:amino acid N-acyltransferase family protein n=1 Tax=Streptomyces chrestomyceticus TaxID=68185 RepID=UPI00340E55AB
MSRPGRRGSRGGREALRAASAGLALLLAAGCTQDSGPDDRRRGRAATVELDQLVALADEPVHIRISGLTAGTKTTVTTHATDHRGMAWSGRAVFTADADGTVDLARDTPRAGTYRGADGMGLLWSMKPAEGDPDATWFIPGAARTAAAYRVRLTVASGGRALAERDLTRTWTSAGVRHKNLTVSTDKVRGSLFLPPAHGPRQAPVLLLGGSEGGLADERAAALLASRGHPALSLCYFGCRGRPENLDGIPLEYFATAAQLLRDQPQADPRRLAVLGVSRGSEAAQMMAQYYPGLVHDAVAYLPSRDTWDAYHPGCLSCGQGRAAWSHHGKDLRLAPIPLDRVRGTVLAVGSGDDRLWPSLAAARSIGQQRNAAGRKHQALLYPKAGHAAAFYPYLPSAVQGGGRPLGGTRAADAHAKADSWPQVLRLLERTAP